MYADIPVCFGTREFSKTSTICKKCFVKKDCEKIRIEKTKHWL